MTIDDTIGHCDVTADVAEAYGHKQIAEKYREIGKWLRELKALKDGDMVSRQAAIDALNRFSLGETDAMKLYFRMDNYLKKLPSAEPEHKWIPCSERMPDEDHWLGGSGKQFSEQVLVTVVNHDDDDVWVDKTHTIDGKWMLELPRYCKIIAWKPMPEPYREESDVD